MEKVFVIIRYESDWEYSREVILHVLKDEAEANKLFSELKANKKYRFFLKTFDVISYDKYHQDRIEILKKRKENKEQKKLAKKMQKEKELLEDIKKHEKELAQLRQTLNGNN